MSEDNKTAGELVKLRSDVLYLIRLVEKLEKKVSQLETKIDQTQQPPDPFAGMHIEKL